MKYFITPFKKIFDFNGKSTIKEFWYFVLINIVIHFLIGVLESSINVEYIGETVRIIVLLPFISLGFRRLNEVGINKFLFLIPFVNFILASLSPKQN